MTVFGPEEDGDLDLVTVSASARTWVERVGGFGFFVDELRPRSCSYARVCGSYGIIRKPNNSKIKCALFMSIVLMQYVSFNSTYSCE